MSSPESKVRCSSCGASPGVGARFCSQCGSALALAQSAAPGDAERKQVTVLFSDLTGFTTLSERLDLEETREIMAQIFRSAAEVVARHGGRIEKFIGDALMALFGVPQAHEDDPLRAVRAALELHHWMETFAPEVEAQAGTRIALHSGISTGLVVTGELRLDRGTAGPLGDTINLAARIMALAAPGEIWVGPATRSLVAGAYELEELGLHELKGKAAPVALARVRGAAREVAAPRRGVFVGRAAELATLLDAVERLRAGGGGAISIVGDAGSGKTRLVEELRARLGSDVRWLEGRARADAEQVPYAPVIDLLSRSFRIATNDSPAAVREKLEGGIAALGGEVEALLPVLARLYQLELAGTMAIDREAFPARILAALRALLVAAAARAPTLVCFQDLHWADASTLGLLRAVTRDFSAPALFLFNHRPDVHLGAGGRALELAELRPEQTRVLLASLLGGDPPDEALARFVVERCDGNPFYAEEIVRSLLETGAVEGPGWRLVRPPAEAEIPSSIRGVLAARIDRLGAGERRLLREAAVVGRQFQPGLLARVSSDAGGLEARLVALEAADLIRQRAGRDGVEYAFKHALTHEVAYDGLLKAERQALHARAAGALEAQLGDRVAEFAEALAFHFLRGGVVEQAVRYGVEAGRKCVGRFALDEAGVHFAQAYALLAGRERTPAEDRALIELLVEWSLVHFYLGRFGVLRELLAAHEELAARLGDPELEGLFLGWLGYALYHQEELPASLAKLERACALGERCGSERVLAYARTWQSHTLFLLGRSAEGLRVAEAARELAPRFPSGGDYVYCESLLGIGLTASACGDLERTRRIGEELLAFAKAGNSRAAVVGHICLAHRHLLANEHERASEAAHAARERAQEPHVRALASAYEAVAGAALGRFGESRALAEDVLAHALPHGDHAVASLAKAALALATLGEGSLSKGMRELLALHEDAGRRRCLYNRRWLGAVVASVYALIARRDPRVEPKLRDLLRNPGFLLRHALPARRRARAWLERALEEFPAGVIQEGTVRLELALLLSRHDPTMARAHLERALAVLERQGAQTELRRVRQLAVALQHGAPCGLTPAG